MDAVKAVKDYVTKMINADGMKVMLLDEETVGAQRLPSSPPQPPASYFR
jgi:hypothetical protein